MPTNLISPLVWQAVPYADPDAFLDFSRDHWLWHIALAQATKTPLVLLDDLRQGELGRHARMHEAVARALGVATAGDLVSYDLRDRESFVGFMATHALDTERLRQAAKL